MVLLLMTVIHFQTLAGLATIVAFVDLTAFFDTIKIGPLVFQLLEEGSIYRGLIR